MVALCSQENPPAPLTIFLNSEDPKNPVRIPLPEFSVITSYVMQQLERTEPVSRTFNPRI